MHGIRIRSIGVVALLSVAALLASAHARQAATPQASPGLGALVFPVSTQSTEARAEFIRGALLLHLFEYDDAAQAFRAAEKLDPGFAMAYWGEAMTHNHGVWNEVDVEAGRAALAKFAGTAAARAARVDDARERAYLGALEILYDGQGTKAQRDARYARAMGELAKDYPDDNQAQLFHALALLGRSEGVRDVPTYLQAAAIAERIFRRNPSNPGAAHYWIHGMDDPEHAAGALEAARELSRIAPDAGHAQHMTSHIFMALGLWDDVERANVNAVRVVDAQRKAAGKPLVACFHYQEWLQYAYFQQGRQAEGLKSLQACHDTGTAALSALQGDEADGFARRLAWSLAMMRARAVVDAGDWNGPAARLAVEIPAQSHAAAWDRFATGYAAAQRGDQAAAQTASTALDALVADATPNPDDLQELGYMRVIDDELAGLVASEGGDAAKGLMLVRRAAERYDAMAFDFGPPVPVKPPHELLGEMLLAAGEPRQARDAFEESLRRAPKRALSLLGLARTQAAAGDADAAKTTYADLLRIWKSADPALPALAEARDHAAANAAD